MKNKLIGIFVILILLVVGLSGCNEFGVGLTNIGDITANPDKYVGKEVTVEGTCSLGIIVDESGHSLMYSYDSLLTGKYRLTGIIKDKDFVGVILEVSSVKAI